MTGPPAGDRMTVVFFPEGAFGPTNNCVGIAQALQRRGARAVFVVEESFAGTLAAQGFEERLVRLKPAPALPEEPGQFWKDFIRETAPELRRPPIEQLAGLVRPIWAELIEGARFAEERLGQIFAELRPAVIVEDNVVAFPAVLRAGCPWVRIVSCNPLEVEDRRLPPALSGLPTDDDRGWAAFRAARARAVGDLQAQLAALVASSGAPALPAGTFIPPSPFLNLTVFPAEMDYARSVPLDGSWHRLDSCVRVAAGTYRLPARLAGGDRPVVYLSLGSLGSGDLPLMERLLEVLGRSPYRVVVSLGPQHQRLRLRENMDGAPFLPQPSVLPQVDVVITHGGNNTVTECVHHGRPMVVLPLFWDQHDNAQRVQECGFGVRLPTYEFREAALLEALEDCLGDTARRARLAGVAARLQAQPGTERAADLIARVGARR